MKKILILFSALGLLSLTSCNNDDDVMVENTNPGSVVENEAFEVGPINFTNTTNIFDYPLNPVIGPNDVLLVYRLTSDPLGNEDFWEPVPATYKFEGDDEINYNIDFSVNTLTFYLTSNFDLATVPNYALNQYFRIVVLKNYNSSANRVNLKDYNAVVKMFDVIETDRGLSNRK